MSWIWAMFPLASLTPSMPSISASLIMVSEVMLDPVLPGMLYTTMGMSTASAMAE